MTSIIALSFLLAPSPAAAQQAPLASTAAVTVEQAYAPVNKRDPMVVSTVYGDTKVSGRAAKAVSAAAGSARQLQAAAPAGVFSVDGLSLTGIMEDSNGRQALLRDGATGALYTLKAGKLRDAKKKAVPGITGFVKNRQVILMTEDKKVHQLGLPEKD